MLNVLETVERVRAVVDAKVPHMDCPACQKDDWVFIPGVAGLQTVFTVDADITVSDTYHTSLAAVAYSCGNCGFVRFHHHQGLMLEP